MRKVGVGKCRNEGGGSETKQRQQETSGYNQAASLGRLLRFRNLRQFGPDRTAGPGRLDSGRVPVGSRPHCQRSLAVRKTKNKCLRRRHEESPPELKTRDPV